MAKAVVSDVPDEGDALDEFTSYLAIEVWSMLLPAVREATYENRDQVPSADEVYLDNIPTSFIDTLTSCAFVEDSDAALTFLRKVLEDYLADVCAPPPMWSKTRTTRETHSKVLKKKWHPESMLNSVAWLCRYLDTIDLKS